MAAALFLGVLLLVRVERSQRPPPLPQFRSAHPALLVARNILLPLLDVHRPLFPFILQHAMQRFQCIIAQCAQAGHLHHTWRTKDNSLSPRFSTVNAPRDGASIGPSIEILLLSGRKSLPQSRDEGDLEN
ncbi:hypothetical protein B0T26DRAFT_722419 [Lasiosphaeria miniovina]|uniref:Secreted protein n=1 Tax=Lasiosphaeria miniovina TaxID=1954250 RepID=A0AA40DQF1_9PEZI|nr:uncharacterized protein B0T26DRAFT_722419 [Lasiosphaeria miniovina]KAK0709656.1 hypothetical protein B0T26DRAFT_722419 [Lasiosphaeria miniovina]